MILIALDWGLSTPGLVRYFMLTSCKELRIIILIDDCANCLITTTGNPTRGVFERAIAAAENAKYWSVFYMETFVYVMCSHQL